MTNQLTRNCLLFSVSLLLLIPCAVLSKEPAATASRQRINLRIEVTAGDEADPISGAEVNVRSESVDSPFERTLQTNRSGVVTFKGVPQVKILIQVTAPGCRTFGKRYDLEEEGEMIAIALAKNS